MRVQGHHLDGDKDRRGNGDLDSVNDDVKLIFLLVRLLRVHLSILIVEHSIFEFIIY